MYLREVQRKMFVTARVDEARRASEKYLKQNIRQRSKLNSFATSSEDTVIIRLVAISAAGLIKACGACSGDIKAMQYFIK